MKQIIVTVGREHGSGGKYIAEQIAKQLGIAFYDKELLLASVFNAEDAARYDEKPVHLLWSRRIGENFNAPEDALAHETFEHIQELADSGESFVVLGRCSDFILRSNPNVRYTSVDSRATFAMVQAGLGVSLNNQLITRGWDTTGIVILPVDPPQYAEIGIAAPAPEELSPAAKRFLAFARQTLRTDPEAAELGKEQA